jgi:hypothetical protein
MEMASPGFQVRLVSVGFDTVVYMTPTGVSVAMVVVASSTVMEPALSGVAEVVPASVGGV